MCGICGILGENNEPAMKAMVAAMHHRGPDDHGEFFSDGISMGMARLSIIDTSPCGHQPMSNPDKTIWIVYNGETYNFREERERLEELGHTFHSASDTEVILHLYEQYGDDCVLRMQGMFAFAIYDIRDREKPRLFIARDPLGIKPLLYAENDQGFIFASEMKSILSSGLVKPEVNPEALRQLLTYGSVTQPNTFISGVRMLLPGHRLIFQHGSHIVENYWAIDVHRQVPEHTGKTYEELCLLLRSNLEKCVRQHMVSDVPVGAFLSGGIDSSILVALMAKCSTIPVKTFSVGFESGSYSTDEADDAETIARFIGTDHTRVVVTGAEVRQRIHHFASSLDQPSVDGLNSYFVSLAASRTVKVAISGTGGDELFAGYPWFITMAKVEASKNNHPHITALIEKSGRFFQNSAFDRCIASPLGRIIDLARGRAGFFIRFARIFLIFPARDVALLLSPSMKKSLNFGRGYEKDLYLNERFSQFSLIQKISALCLENYTRNQLLRDIDVVSMSHSLEVRVPFLDRHLAEFAFSLPDETKLGDFSKISSQNQSYRSTGAKRILIDSCKDLLPKDIDLQEKRGFGMPFEAWMKGSLKDVIEDTLSEDSIKKRGLFNSNAIQKLTIGFFRNEKTGWSHVWLLMIIELWCREVIDTCPYTRDYP